MKTFSKQLNKQLSQIKKEGLYKNEHILTSQQETSINVQGYKKVLNFCANNYLGLSNHPQLIKASKSRGHNSPHPNGDTTHFVNLISFKYLNREILFVFVYFFNKFEIFSL